MTTDTGLIEFFAPGIPRPKGSIRAFVRAGKAILTSDNARLVDWHGCVQRALYDVQRPAEPWQGPIRVHLNFYLPKPKRPKCEAHVTKPDVDKLVRSTLDVMTGVIFRDDSQVMAMWVTKQYAGSDGPGCRIRVEQV